MKTNDEKRNYFEKLWLDCGGHFDYFVFDDEIQKYDYSGFTGGLSKEDLMMARITLNTAYVFYLGGWKQSDNFKI